MVIEAHQDAKHRSLSDDPDLSVGAYQLPFLDQHVFATVIGGDGNDFIHRAGDGLTPPAGYNEITGVTTGDDQIDGGAGNDIIYGDVGADTITGGAGTDQLYGGIGFDTFVVNHASEISGLAEYIDGGSEINTLQINADDGPIDLSKATILNVQELVVTGEGVNDIYMTSGQFQPLISVAGPDVALNIDFVGQTNISETYFSSSGEISYYGAIDATNYIHLSGRLGYHTILVGGNLDDDLLLSTATRDANGYKSTVQIEGGAGDDRIEVQHSEGYLLGGDGNDYIIGGPGHDLIHGNDGDDTIIGGKGRDQMSGEAGADTFVYRSVGDSPDLHSCDLIRGFDDTEGDKIDLSAIDANTNKHGNQSFHLLAGDAFTGHSAQLIEIEEKPNNYLIEGDVNGDGVADIVIHVNLAHAGPLVATDFVL